MRKGEESVIQRIRLKQETAKRRHAQRADTLIALEGGKLSIKPGRRGEIGYNKFGELLQRAQAGEVPTSDKGKDDCPGDWVKEYEVAQQVRGI